MTHNLYQPRSYWALTQLLISGLIGSWVPQTGELIYCLLNLKFFFHSRSCLHQAVTPATLPLSKSSKWLLLSATGPESSLGQPISLATMILFIVDCLWTACQCVWSRAFTLRSKSESQQCCPLVPSFHLVKIPLGPQACDSQDTGRCEGPRRMCLGKLNQRKIEPSSNSHWISFDYD